MQLITHFTTVRHKDSVSHDRVKKYITIKNWTVRTTYSTSHGIQYSTSHGIQYSTSHGTTNGKTHGTTYFIF